MRVSLPIEIDVDLGTVRFCIRESPRCRDALARLVTHLRAAEQERDTLRTRLKEIAESGCSANLLSWPRSDLIKGLSCTPNDRCSACRCRKLLAELDFQKPSGEVAEHASKAAVDPREGNSGDAPTLTGGDVSASSVRACRRCSECRNADHHFSDAIMNDAGEWVCKHCEVIAEECGSCNGEGQCDAVPCSACKGSGLSVTNRYDVEETKPCAWAFSDDSEPLVGLCSGCKDTELPN